MKISDQTYSIGAFLGKDPEDVKQQKQDKLEQQIEEVQWSITSDIHCGVFELRESTVSVYIISYSF